MGALSKTIIMAAMSSANHSPLANIEPRLRSLLPADLYAQAWVDPSPATLIKVFEHLRTLQRILYDHTPRQLSDDPPRPGQVRHSWQESTLMFTDLAGFTPLVEANAARGKEGAASLLQVLNTYFAEMLEIISKSGGNLLEFTGDALLVQFSPDQRQGDTAQAVRAGLRMQRAMARFVNIETPDGPVTLGMRIGLHTGRFLTADIGTPRRMDHVLLGNTVQTAKRTEGAGEVGRVCLTETAYERVKDLFRFNTGQPGYMLVMDDFSPEQLGEYDLAPSTRRQAQALLFDRSVPALVSAIEELVGRIEPVAGFLPSTIINLLVENASRRQITPDFPEPTVVFVNMIGLPESVDIAQPGEEAQIIASFSWAFALINAAVEARGGVLKKITYHLAGSDMMIYFGAPNAHTNDSMRAAGAALAIRDAITSLVPPTVGGKEVTISCQIGIARGPVFVAEVGEPRGRREFNVIGDTVNTAARLMGRAIGNRILMTEAVYKEIAHRYECQSLGAMPLKGKAKPMPVFALKGLLESKK